MADIKPESYQCSECSAGMMHLRHITYFTWLDEELVTVPNFPAWVCDVCGRREYDPRALNHLSMLLSPNAGKSPAQIHPEPPIRRSKKDIPPPGKLT